jgi:hypothetical protein
MLTQSPASQMLTQSPAYQMLTQCDYEGFSLDLANPITV